MSATVIGDRLSTLAALEEDEAALEDGEALELELVGDRPSILAALEEDEAALEDGEALELELVGAPLGIAFKTCIKIGSLGSDLAPAADGGPKALGDNKGSFFFICSTKLLNLSFNSCNKSPTCLSTI